MAFSDADDVANALRRALTANETTYVSAVIAEADALILGYLGCDPTDADATPTVPVAVTLVSARMVARVFQQDGQQVGTQQQTAGPFSTSYVAGATSGSPWLAASDKLTLRPHRCGGGMRSVLMGSERGYDTTDDEDDS